MREKEEVDEDCRGCKHFYYLPAVLYPSDAAHPAEIECDLDWMCPYLEDEEDDSDESS